MPDNPALSAYCVSLFFEGTVALATIIAGSEAEAVAQVSVQIARQHDKPLVGIGIMRLEAEWMRFALKTLESGEPHKAPVVSLVSDNLRPQTGMSPVEANQIVAAARHSQEALDEVLKRRYHQQTRGPQSNLIAGAGYGTCPRHRWQGLAWEACPHCQNQAAHLLPTEAPDPA
jgi:hypothetical protein